MRDVSRNHIERGWDHFVRVVSSIDSGVTAATLALQRFGAVSRAEPIRRAETALGKILLTLFLCNLITNPDSAAPCGAISRTESLCTRGNVLFIKAESPRSMADTSMRSAPSPDR